MNLNIRQQFSVNAAPTAVWDFLQDGEAVGKCMPGVQHVERMDDHSYRAIWASGSTDPGRNEREDHHRGGHPP